jgi:hypothetical protein
MADMGAVRDTYTPTVLFGGMEFALIVVGAGRRLRIVA